MSVDTEVKISKEERRKQKEEKKARKATKAAAATEAGEAVVEETKKEKKDKKRSRDEEGGDEVKKSKKSKSKSGEATPALDTGASTPQSTEVSTPAEGEAPALSKKQLKKLKAAAAASEASTAAAASIPAPAAFTAADKAYLAEQNITLEPSLFPPHLDMSTLAVNASIAKFLTVFPKPTPIQAVSWPALLAKRDVVGIAETGSGKTLSFGVPGVNHIASLPAPGKKGKGKLAMLVLAPTRELAQQSFDTLVKLGKECGVAAVALFGGMPKGDQIRQINTEGVRIVVGTPGRTLDLADSGDLDLSSVSYLVLDEADRMLDAGFENDIRRIIAHCPKHEGGRQTVMFSATWPESVRRLASTFLTNPVKVTVGSDELSANKRITQVVEVLDTGRDKDPRLAYHLRTHLKAAPGSRVLVFGLYKKEAQRLEQTIRRSGHKVGALHGDMNQNDRFKALEAFKDGSVNVLVATDVAARGLDIPDVQLVINVTFPLTTEDFVHRCGRTGRAGKTGRAVTFFTGEAHERALAGEFMRVLRDAGAEVPKEMDRFPNTIKKKEHGAYGSFYRETTNAPAATKITFD
ncbi:RNA-dependent ATPase [Apiotrichum porosum]|uniref:RNA helicase n=1 Tax=Apiotrichum porosum TaxID=105984 RepID=A0A427XEQ5_9TREE|nr:RNA-dependent ATPase [Apiotrichum porosum]RSH77389.1 RNA-dependent ATPase [Apiotrichum porosum]